jgi:hypothetical protein
VAANTGPPLLVHRTPLASTVAGVKVLLPWLAVLAVVLLLDALHLGVLATAVAVTWLVYCVWTWVRPRKSNRAG